MFPIVLQGDPSFNPGISYASLSPRVSDEDAPESRAAKIAQITQSFGVHESWSHALDRELRGETRGWERHRALTGCRAPIDEIDDGGQRRLRTLMVTHDLSRTGAPMVIVHLAGYLTSLGHRVTILSPTDGPLRDEFEGRAAHVVIYPGALIAPYVLGDVFAAHDVVLANTILCWRVVVAATATRAPAVWLINESDFGRTYARAHPPIARAFVTASRVVFPSSATRDRYREFDTGNQEVIHYGITPVAASADAFVKVPGRFYVIVVASIESRKGQDVLIAAFDRLPSRVRGQMEVFFLGRSLEPHYYRDVRASADRVGGIHFLSHMSNADTMRFVATCDVLVCCSRDETGPLVVLEAMALGLPVVSTRVGAMPEIISDGESGLLVDTEDPAALAAALVRLYDDRELASRVGASGRDLFGKYLTLDRYGAAMFHVLQAAVDVRKAHGDCPASIARP
jgi:glycosyltransferase involved in cell wall biosynthesis